MAMFNAESLQRRYAYVDQLPPELFRAVLTLSEGGLRERVEGAAAWRAALLRGVSPDDVDWPAPIVRQPVLDLLQKLDIARFCRGQEELTDVLLVDIIETFKGLDGALEEQVRVRLRELEAEERQLARSKQRSAEALRALAAQQARAAGLGAAADGSVLAGVWRERARIWAELAGVFDDLGSLLGLGWDLSAGVLKHTGWQDLLKLRALMEQLPALSAVIRELGRLQERDDAPPIVEEIFAPIQRVFEEQESVRTPLAPTEARGVERSGSIARMLPAEAALLHHPTLRLLWHARRAERALMSYRFEGLLTQRTLMEREEQEARREERPRHERGPIMVCLDTSGSMSGLPETVAKALTLEAMRVAHTENRRCYLYSFSGPQQVVEQELDLSPDGLGRLLGLLSSSFHGGTDITTPMTRALSRLGEDEWARSDILLVSDGEFPVSSDILRQVESAREERHLRVHGVLIGGGSHGGLHRLCEPLHRFSDWNALSSRQRS